MASTLDTYVPFTAGSGVIMTEAQWEAMARNFLRDGVILAGLNEGLVFADATGMQVKVATGQVMIRGHYGEWVTQRSLSIGAAHASLTRIDRVVARLNVTTHLIELDVLAGTAGSGAAPALTQTSTVWELPLARVTVPGGDTTVDAGQVTDERGFARPHSVEVGDGKVVFYNAPANSAELFLQGQTVSRVTYPGLFAIFGTAFGAGDGSTTFVLPNLQGGALTVRDPGQAEFDSIGERGGAKSATLTTAQIPPLPFTTGGESNDHVHETLIRKFGVNIDNSNPLTPVFDFYGDPADPLTAFGTLVTPDTSGQSRAHSHSGVTSSGGSAVSLLQPYAVVNVAVRAR